MQRLLLKVALAGVLIAGAMPLAGPALADADPQGPGLATERLARIGDAIGAAVNDGEIAGAVALIQRRGQTAYLESFGMADFEAARPMQADDLFRIASMTKPVTSVAVMMLYEEGRLQLDDPVGRYLPEFDRELLVVSPAGDSWEFVTAKRPITIRDLLTHTSGIGYRFMGSEPLTSLYTEAGIFDGLVAGQSNAEFVDRLATMPLAHQPGERWTYGLNTDVLGHLVERMTGQSLDRFLDERLFSPLGMDDTFFVVPRNKQARLVAVYRRDDGRLSRLPGGVIEDGPVVFSVDYPFAAKRFSGGAGLVSSAQDYARFLQMLLNGGELDGVRILGPKTVEFMTSDQTSRLGVESFEGLAFGLGFAIEDGPAGSGRIGTPGSFGWGGFFNTDAWADPEEALVAVILTQHYPFGIELLGKYRALVYQAIVD